MKCNVCGREIDEDSQFCEFCGAKVSRSKIHAEKQPSPFAFKPVYLWILSAIVIVLGLVCLLTIHKPTNKAESDLIPTIIDKSQDEEPAPTFNANAAEIIALSSISLNKSSVTLEVGKSSTLSVVFAPSEATNKEVIWKSTNPNVATVNDGKVTAVSLGSSTIIAICDDKEALCNVTVKEKVSTIGTHNNHDFVDLGLSVKWATCNVGASKAEEVGNSYAWGETETKSTYNSNTYKYYVGLGTQKYCTKVRGGVFEDVLDHKSVLEPSDDVAHVKWGGNWRIPTKTDWQELIDNCSFIWTSINGIKGYKVTSKKNGFKGQSIFIPKTGSIIDDKRSQDGFSSYWSSSLYLNYPAERAVDFSFLGEGHYEVDCAGREFGLSIRPVCP